MLDHARRFDCRLFVETGTFEGQTTEWMRPYFTHVYSIELSDHYYAEAVKFFAGYSGVTLLKGDSGEKLGELMPRLHDRTLFWLDGHYSCGLTAGGASASPIMREIEHILGAPDLGHVLLIDDLHEFGHTDGYPTFDELCAHLHRLRPNIRINCIGNIICATPSQ